MKVHSLRLGLRITSKKDIVDWIDKIKAKLKSKNVKIGKHTYCRSF